MSAQRPLESLDDYVSGHMPDEAAAGFEEELFARAAAGGNDDAAFLDRVARFGAFLASRSGLAMGSTRAHVDALMASGLRVHFFDMGAPRGLIDVPSWPDGTDLVVTRLHVDTRGFEHVDVEIIDGAGKVVKVIRDVQSDPLDGTIYAVCEEPLAKSAFSLGHTISRFTGVREGKRELLAEFESQPARS